MLPAVIPAGELTLEQIIDQHCRARQATTTIKAKFTQTKVFTLFEETEISSGTLFFARPDRICWQYRDPDKSTIVIKSDAGWSVFPHIKQIQKFKLNGSKTNKILSIVGFSACGTALTDTFDIELGEGGNDIYLLLLKPIDPDVTPFFSRIDLFLDRSDFLPRKIVLHEKSGDLLRFNFTDLERNKILDESVFELVVPDDYEVVEY
jgi:outer membrane lipoprotein-sorting protein